MINLDGLQPFAEGGNRQCFIHPNNSYRCLKVSLEEQSKKVKQNAPWYKKLRSEKSFDDNLREQKAYDQRALRKDNSEKWKHLAKWYGMVETSIGPASETELIRDNQNNIASTLETYLFSYGIPHNVVLGYEGEKIVLKIIDGLGSKSYLPLTQVSDVFAKRYVERRIELMRSRINWDLTGRQGDWK
jgi:hypothetical protein